MGMITSVRKMCEDREKSEIPLAEKHIFRQTLVDFAGLLEFEGGRFMSRVGLFTEVRVNLNVGCRGNVDWGHQGVDGRRVRVGDQEISRDDWKSGKF